MKSHLAISRNKEHSGRRDLSPQLPKLISILLLILPLLTYWQLQNFEFINMDDPLYGQSAGAKRPDHRRSHLGVHVQRYQLLASSHMAVPYG